jgi:hypothetical protein
MSGLARRRSLLRFGLLALLVAGALAHGGAAPSTAAAALPRWDGSVDLYRSGVFTTQKSWLWCTAADVQIARNIADGKRDHTKANQQRYFRYMRARNRYDIPVKDGVDPAGWTAGLRHYVDRRYRLTTNGSFDAAVRSAVTNLRRTNLPVGITVAHGNHAWLLTGFSATADPAKTKDFRVTSVRVVGPLWGLQSRSYGYDMRPNKKLTPKQLKGFFTPWHYAGVKMAWEGRWVSIQPVAAASSTSAATPRPTTTSTPAATAAPSTTPTAPPPPSSTPTPTIAAPSPSSAGATEPTPSAVVVARAEPRMTEQPDPPVEGGADDLVAGLQPVTAVALMVAAVAAVAAVLAFMTGRTRRRRP